MPSSREQAAEDLVDTCVCCQLTDNLFKQRADRDGRSVWLITFGRETEHELTSGEIVVFDDSRIVLTLETSRSGVEGCRKRRFSRPYDIKLLLMKLR